MWTAFPFGQAQQKTGCRPWKLIFHRSREKRFDFLRTTILYLHRKPDSLAKGNELPTKQIPIGLKVKKAIKMFLGLIPCAMCLVPSLK